ncbi:hypothetical protein CBR_g31248 [Chara braunii]|uniref:Reverse transcriptase domain-containing protein n=1 Tax=Chara braunii TaxID=69332 RepID=A0A388JXZ2_CHABU|nr:hypothetical protein CBR_g31248 [Chara braunii]|eukprot:GBG62612.1 hypothetical protein CBR_g31248 [Chara braunii]
MSCGDSYGRGKVVNWNSIGLSSSGNPLRRQPGSCRNASTSYDVNRGRSASPRRVKGEAKGKATTQEPEELGRQIEELNKSLVAVSEFVMAEKVKKAEAERLRIEAKEEAERLEAEQKAREKKEQKRIEKRIRDAQRTTEIDKKMELQLAIKTSDFFNRMEASLGPVLDFVRKVKPVKQQMHIPSNSGDESYESATEDIRARTKKLTIHEKRKRGPEVEFEDRLSHPKVDGHVCFRLCDGDIQYQRLSNVNDIPRPDVPNRRSLLHQEIVSGFSNWFNLRGAISNFSVFDFQACFGVTYNVPDKISLDEVITVKRECEGFLLTPLDRNAGETLIMCPLVYHRAMMDSFVTNVGYRVVQEQESEVLARVKTEDTNCFRPICPTFKEPMVKTGRVVAKALNHLQFQLPDEPSTGVESASHDIKEMFSRLPHEDILDVVTWIVEHYRGKGKSFVRVNTRGRVASFEKTAEADHWRQLDLDDMIKFVRLELKHTYTYATGVLLRQVVGIPTGKSTSPPLACILCAYAECKFLNSLGVFRKRVFGIRLIDDITLVTFALSDQQRDKVLDTFERCYPHNLVLKRTDTWTDTLPFLGM